MQNVNCLRRVLTGERKARKNCPGDFSPILSLSLSLVPLSTRLIFPIHRWIRFRACISISRWPQSPLRMRGLKNIHVIEVTASILSCAWKLQSFPQNKERQASKYQNVCILFFRLVRSGFGCDSERASTVGEERDQKAAKRNERWAIHSCPQSIGL